MIVITEVSVANLIPGVREPHANVLTLERVTPDRACRWIRESFAEKGSDYDAWTQLIRSHARISPVHPFRELLVRKGVLENDPLWTLGALAFGSSNPWIVIIEIQWADGERSRPEEMERRWLASSSPPAVSR